MKKHILSIFLAALLFLCSCNGNVPGTEMDESGFEESTDSVIDSSVTLHSGGSSISLKAEPFGLQIVSLITPSGSVLVENSDFALPQSVFDGEILHDIAWTFQALSVGDGYAEYCFENAEIGLGLTVRCTAYTDTEAPFVFDTVFYNKTETTMRLYPAEFASVTVMSQESPLELWSIHKESDHAEGILNYNGKGIYKRDLQSGKTYVTWTSVFQNSNSNGYFPAVYLNNNNTNGLFVALEWTSGKIVTTQDKEGKTTSLVSMDCVGDKTETFTTRVNGGDAFVLPSVYIMAYDGDTDSGSNLLKSWFYSERVISNISDNPAEPLTQMDMQRGLEADNLNVDAIKWDYGWWTYKGFDGQGQPLEGSWELRHNAYKNVLKGYNVSTLAEFGALAKERGVAWTVYLLLHDTLDENFKPTNAYGPFNSVDHPEWFSSQKVTDYMGACADLGDEECVAYLQTALTEFFSTNNITTWRSDFQPICYFSDKRNRHDANGTDVMYWCTVGFSELLDHLYANVEGFRYECCSSGGSMKDLYTARRSAVFQLNDDSNYLSARAVFYDSSYILPAAQLQFALNADFSNTTVDTFMPVTVTCDDPEFDLHDTMMDMGYRTMMLGVPMFSSWTGTIEDDYYIEYGALYRDTMRDLVKNAELYHILPRPDGTNWDGMMYADPDTENDIKGAVFLFKPSDTVSDTYTVVLRGLNPDTTYSLQFEDRPEQNITASGEQLMTEGIQVEIKYIGSEIIWILEANTSVE
ncbi:MAG: hypothetical protein E7658_02385 [Ruminococcaceae bacterium]|nr:hypothetical protein [Oscillospiraceae bacterium]